MQYMPQLSVTLEFFARMHVPCVPSCVDASAHDGHHSELCITSEERSALGARQDKTLTSPTSRWVVLSTSVGVLLCIQPGAVGAADFLPLLV